MKKSIGVMNWLKASTDAALTLQPASAQVRPRHVVANWHDACLQWSGCGHSVQLYKLVP